MTDPTSSEGMSAALHGLYRARRKATSDNVASTIAARGARQTAPHLSDEQADTLLHRAGAYRTESGDVVVGDTEENR